MNCANQITHHLKSTTTDETNEPKERKAKAAEAGEDDWLEAPTLPTQPTEVTTRTRQRKKQRATEVANEGQRDLIHEAVTTWASQRWQPTEAEAQKKMDALSWWAKYENFHPLIASVARRTLALQASSAASERSFSRAGLIVTKKRHCLREERIDGLSLVGWYCDEMHRLDVPESRKKVRRSGV